MNKEKFPDWWFFRLTMDFQVMGAIDPKEYYTAFREWLARTRLVKEESFNSKWEFDWQIVWGKVEYISRLKRTREKNKLSKWLGY